MISSSIYAMEPQEKQYRVSQVYEHVIYRKRFEISLHESLMAGKVVLSEDKQNIQFPDFWNYELSYIKPIKKTVRWPSFKYLVEGPHNRDLPFPLQDMFSLLQNDKKDTSWCILNVSMIDERIEEIYELQKRRVTIFYKILCRYNDTERLKLIQEIEDYRKENKDEVYALFQDRSSKEIAEYLMALDEVKFDVHYGVDDDYQTCNAQLATLAKIPLKPLKEIVSELYAIGTN